MEKEGEKKCSWVVMYGKNGKWKKSAKKVETKWKRSGKKVEKKWNRSGNRVESRCRTIVQESGIAVQESGIVVES